MKQPSFLDYTDEGGPTDNCSPLMSAGRGPFRSTKDFIKKYGLRLVAATFLIIDSSQVRLPHKTENFNLNLYKKSLKVVRWKKPLCIILNILQSLNFPSKI